MTIDRQIIHDKERQTNSPLIIKSDIRYCDVVFLTFVWVFTCYGVTAYAILHNRLAFWQIIACLFVLTISLYNLANVPLFWKLEISKYPRRCVVKRRKLFSWDTLIIDDFYDFGYVGRTYRRRIRLTDTDWLVFKNYEDGQHRLIFAVEMQGKSTKKIIESIADYLGQVRTEYEDYKINPWEYGMMTPADMHLHNIVLAFCLIVLINPNTDFVLLGIVGALWLFLKRATKT